MANRKAARQTPASTQVQVHVVHPSNPTPPAVVFQQCQLCNELIWSGTANTQRLAQVLATARREHAVIKHGWLPGLEVADARTG